MRAFATYRPLAVFFTLGALLIVLGSAGIGRFVYYYVTEGGGGHVQSLVLSAAAQAGAIEESMHRFAAAQPSSCVLTKLDEATSLGGAVSALIRTGLPLAYVSDGQRVPEDLRPARALELVSSAVQLAQASGATADEDLLRRRFGELAHALA